jgi:thiamine kinase-like enzyme
MPSDRQPLHGDAHPGNLIAGPGGFVWADFEESCAGPVGWDLASFARTRRFDPRVALAAYGDVPDLADLLKLRSLHGLVWWAILAEVDPKHRPILDERLAELRAR